MSIENMILLGAVLLGFLQLGLAGMLVTKARGPAWNLSPRDEPQPPLTGMAGRADRAFTNFKETFPLFLAAVFLVMHTGHAGNLSTIGAYMYLGARVIYVPLYLFGVTGVRTLAWLMSAIGILLILWQAAMGG